MALQDRGYAGKILHADLTTNSFRTEPLKEKEAYLLLGGKGLATWLLYRKTKAGLDPLSPSNPLIFATGPLTGTAAPSSSRFCVVTKSPATGSFLDSYCGGHFGPELKYSGYDAVVIVGQAKEPSTLLIEDGRLDLLSAKNLWGATTTNAEGRLKTQLGKEFRIATIGPAGERQIPIAGIFSDNRTAGRGGAGAVMGSKKLKAIAVRGSGVVRVDDPEKFKESAWIAHRTLRMNEITVRTLPEFGTVNILETINETGALPTRNFQTGRFQNVEEIASESWRKGLWKKDIACFGCPVACSKIAYIEKGPYAGTTTDGPDYETVFSLGPNCGVNDKEAIAYANYLCDTYGIDTISTGNIIAFAMELYEKGVLSIDDLDGIEAKWGDADALIKLVEKICKGKGVGKLLEQGVKKVSQNYPESKRFAMHVKGLELPGYEPRAAQGMGLCYAVSERGACHLKAYTAGTELCGYGGGTNPLSYDETKVQLAINRQDEKAVADSAVLCYFALFGMRLKEVYQMIVSCTGFSYQGVEDLKKLGARVTTFARMFNVREGFTRRDDTLPPRLLEEALPEGPAKGQVVHLEPMLNEYYRLRGWDENGIPTAEKLKELELTRLTENLRAHATGRKDTC